MVLLSPRCCEADVARREMLVMVIERIAFSQCLESHPMVLSLEHRLWGQGSRYQRVVIPQPVQKFRLRPSNRCKYKSVGYRSLIWLRHHTGTQGCEPPQTCGFLALLLSDPSTRHHPFVERHTTSRFPGDTRRRRGLPTMWCIDLNIVCVLWRFGFTNAVG